MTRLATMGTSSCATLALQGFKNEDILLEKAFKEKGDKAVYPKPHSKDGNNLNVADFYSQILYPTTQNLGRTGDYPFSYLMDLIQGHRTMKGKFIVITINSVEYNRGFWPEKFEGRGFKLLDVTKNSLGGQLNYIYVFNEARPAHVNVPDIEIEEQ